MSKFRLLIATGNPGKVNELRPLLVGVPLTLLSLNQISLLADIEETGSTFEENAVLKAAGYARRSGIWALADDSGLEVEGLGGRPGVHSARYGGSETGFDEKIKLLLAEIAETGDAERRARFVCSAALADPEGMVRFAAEGICAGTIAAEPRGTGGFGYDPVFVPDGFDRTFGELPAAIKQQISHRGRAIAKIIPFLRDFLDV
jgi:XTP/dITP diphosphohydrolase